MNEQRKSAAWATLVGAARRRLGMSQREMAEALDLSPPYISRWENHGWVPSFWVCRMFAKQFSLCVDEVMAAAGYDADGP